MINDGTTEKSRLSPYMDQVKSGWKDVWVGLTFYTDLNNMAELYNVLGNKEKRQLYQSLTDKFGYLFDETCWNESVAN